MPFDTAGRTNDVKASSSDVRIALARLIDAHERVLCTVRAAARRAADLGDDGTNDLLVSDVVRTNEKQAWFVREHLRGDGR